MSDRLRSMVYSAALLLLLGTRLWAGTAAIKALIVTAHPDDESEMAATAYRIAQELGGIIDQVIITDGEAGYHYSLLAERVYGQHLTNESVGRSALPAIRRRETLNAGRILGIRHHFFLDQKDTRKTTDASDVLAGVWKVASIRSYIRKLMLSEKYDFVFTLLPTAEAHGQHKAATLLTLEAVSELPRAQRPVVLGVETILAGQAPREFTAPADRPEARVLSKSPAFCFDRDVRFGFHNALSYEIVVNWVIAEHKSQGLFQTEVGKRRWEDFWVFAAGRADSGDRAAQLFQQIAPERGFRFARSGH